MRDKASADNPFISLSTDKFCAYHKKRTAKYPISQLGPEGLCFEMYYALYPFCFSFVYQAYKNKNKLLIKCPTHNDTSFILSKSKADIPVRIKNILKDFLSSYKVFAIEGYNVDIIANQVFEKCFRGKKCRFNINGKFSYICPAAFNAIFPHIFYELKNKKYTDKIKMISCPDHVVDLKFKFVRNPQSKEYEDCGCYDFSKIKLKITDIHKRKEDEFYIDQIINAYNFKCFTAYQVLFPYYLTLLNGGFLGFYTNNKYSAIVQCPNFKHKVEFMIYRDPGNKKIYHKVFNHKDACPMGYKKDETMEITGHPYLSPYILYIAYLYCVYLKNDDSHRPISFRDPITDNGIVYKIIYKGEEENE